MSLDDVIERLRRREADFAGLGYRVWFEVEGAGPVLVDGTSTTPVIAPGGEGDEDEADCTIRLSPETLEQLLAGALSPTWAYTTGKLKVEGSLGVAMKLASRLEED